MSIWAYALFSCVLEHVWKCKSIHPFYLSIGIYQVPFPNFIFNFFFCPSTVCEIFHASLWPKSLDTPGIVKKHNTKECCAINGFVQRNEFVFHQFFLKEKLHWWFVPLLEINGSLSTNAFFFIKKSASDSAFMKINLSWTQSGADLMTHQDFGVFINYSNMTHQNAKHPSYHGTLMNEDVQSKT